MNSQLLHNISIWTSSGECIGTELGVNGLDVSNAASAFNPVTSTAYFIPFWLGSAVSVTKVFWLNGTTVQGSIDVGIYDKDGTYILSAGSTTQSSGTSTPQVVTLTNPVIIGPGQFYLAVSMNQTQGHLFRFLWTTTTLGTMAGMKYLFDQFPLPTTNVTFTNLTNTDAPLPLRALPYCPDIGFYSDTFD